MSLRFIDGFDHYVTADIAKKWTANDFCTINASSGRRGTASMRHSSFGSFLRLTLENQAIWIVGMAFRFTAFPASGVGILVWLDGTTTQVSLRVEPSGLLTVYRSGTSGTLLGTSSTALTVNTYYFLEWYVRIHGTLGEAHVHLNGASLLALTNVNTAQSGNAFASQLRLGNIVVTSNAAMGTQDYDDVYVCDGTGSAPHNTFLGDCRVDTLLPNAEGATQQWTPSTPGTHYTLVDEAAPNLTDYVSSFTPTQRELFGMQDLSVVTGTIYGVQLGLAVQKSDAGGRNITSVIRSGASEALGATAGVGTSQLYILQMQMTDPATSAAWTEAGVNAAQCGAEVA